MTWRLVIWPPLAVLLLLGSTAPAAAQPYGALAQLGGSSGCVKQGGGDGCTTSSVIGDVGDVAVSPDGKNVYTISIASNTIAAYSRDAVAGAITTQVGCFNGSGCTSLGSKLSLGYGIAVSPDGKNVYAVGYSSKSILTFARDGSTGALAYSSCISSSVISGCSTSSTANVLDGADALAISPDGKNVYVTAFDAGALIRYDRNTTTGALTEAWCFKPSGCGATANGMTGPLDVGVSPDGASVYVAAAGSGDVAEFTRSSTGSITQPAGSAGCIGPTAGCASLHGLSSPNGLAISPDGKNVYVAGRASNSLAVLDRAASGALSQDSGVGGCVASGTAGCGSATGLAVASEPAVSPDDRNVYVGTGYDNAGVDDALVAFDRNTTTGKLTQLTTPDGCFNSAGAGGCSTARELNDVTRVAVGPEGTAVYTGAYSSDALGIYRRELPPTCQNAANGVFRNDRGGDVQLPCSDPNGDAITRSIATAPAHGVITAIDQSKGRATYSPLGRYYGTDQFTFSASDGSLSSSPATAAITLTDKIGPLMEFGKGNLRLRRGAVKVKLTCAKTELDGCPKLRLTIGSSRKIKFTLRRKITMGRARLNLKAGQTKRVRVKLSRTARSVVRRLRSTRVRLTATSKDPTGNVGKTTKAARLVARHR